ncbi:hypothetical protein [Streptomyces hokutonensis]|uniref:hypothetical protein n=1 Tax=Streptomyces hokutonensis TaxID=1306990 RepID=UPI0036B9829B
MRDRSRATSTGEGGPAQSGNRTGSTYQSVLLEGQKAPASEQTRGIPARNTTGGRR